MAKKETVHLTTDYQTLNDQDLESSILEYLENDGRLDLDELEISCRKDVVCLEGIIPSENEHQIMITDYRGEEHISNDGH